MQWLNYLPQRAKVLAQLSNLTPQRAKNIVNQRANNSMVEWSNYLPQRAEILSQRSQRVNSTGKEYCESTNVTQWANYLPQRVPQRAKVLTQRSNLSRTILIPQRAKVLTQRLHAFLSPRRANVTQCNGRISIYLNGQRFWLNDQI